MNQQSTKIYNINFFFKITLIEGTVLPANQKVNKMNFEHSTTPGGGNIHLFMLSDYVLLIDILCNHQ